VAIPAISAATGFTPVTPTLPTVSPPGAAGAAGGGEGFAAKLADGMDQLQKMHSTADNLAVKAATGSLTDAHDYMIASTQAALATQLTVAVRNKAVEAFNEIMRMQA
jgi:flagellar hook-basal body complex protein FliE